MATTTFGAADGFWHDAANWSNGVPTSTLSAIVTSGVSGLPILGFSQSAITANLTGGGTVRVGVQAGAAGPGAWASAANALTVVSPSKNVRLQLISVEALERSSATAVKPIGHG